jgi:hypothetical protein
LKGEELQRQLQKWAKYGTIEPDAAEAISAVRSIPREYDLMIFRLPKIHHGAISLTNTLYCWELDLLWDLS